MTGLKKWRILETGCGSASWNMSVDEALLNNFKEDDLPILRLYSWEPSLSLGRFSSIYKSVDGQKLDEEKISYVRRITGGGVLVHGGDLCYTLLLPRKFLENKSVKESYHYLCQFLIRLYEKLGLDAKFSSDLQLEERKSDICLAGNEAYDIMIKGKKMGGNAQRYTRHALFQHGSIPIQVDKSRFKTLFLGENGLDDAATLEELGCKFSYEELTILCIEAFKESFDANIVEDTLHPLEEQSARELLADKYTQQRWNVHAEQDCS